MTVKLQRSTSREECTVRQRGVTLIQMMLAVAMVALLTQLGMPAYARLSENLHGAAAARELAQALRSARGHAMLQGREVLVRPIENDWGKGWRVLLAHNQQLLREHRLARPMKIAENAGGQVTFNAQGMPEGRFGATLSVCERTSTRRSHTVVISRAGKIDLRTGETTGSPCAGN